jgi:hypothetical protein
MTRFSGSSILSLAGALALLAGACSSSGSVSPGGSAGGSGSGAGGTGVSSGGVVLLPNANGFVQDATTNVIGAWFVYGDSLGADATSATSDCVMKGGFMASQCTQFLTPMPVRPFAPSDNPITIGQMCTKGTAAKVIAGTSGALDYSDLFGGGIGLDFNNPGGDAGVEGTFPLNNYSGISFNFTGNVPAGMNMRVNFPFSGEHNPPNGDSPYWAASATAAYSPIVAGLNTVKWANVLGPYYLTQQTPAIVPPPFMPSEAYGIEFQVFTNKNTATPFDFCVDSLTLLPPQ